MKQDTENGIKHVSVNIDQMQRWNNDKHECECKELIDKGASDKGYDWNPSNCECKCYKSCDFGEYLEYESCKCRKNQLTKQLMNVFKPLKK